MSMVYHYGPQTLQMLTEFLGSELVIAGRFSNPFPDGPVRFEIDPSNAPRYRIKVLDCRGTERFNLGLMLQSGSLRGGSVVIFLADDCVDTFFYYEVVRHVMKEVAIKASLVLGYDGKIDFVTSARSFCFSGLMGLGVRFYRKNCFEVDSIVGIKKFVDGLGAPEYRGCFAPPNDFASFRRFNNGEGPGGLQLRAGLLALKKARGEIGVWEHGVVTKEEEDRYLEVNLYWHWLTEIYRNNPFDSAKVQYLEAFFEEQGAWTLGDFTIQPAVMEGMLKELFSTGTSFLSRFKEAKEEQWRSAPRSPSQSTLRPVVREGGHGYSGSAPFPESVLPASVAQITGGGELAQQVQLEATRNFLQRYVRQIVPELKSEAFSPFRKTEGVARYLHYDGRDYDLDQARVTPFADSAPTDEARLHPRLKALCTKIRVLEAFLKHASELLLSSRSHYSLYFQLQLILLPKIGNDASGISTIVRTHFAQFLGQMPWVELSESGICFYLNPHDKNKDFIYALQAHGFRVRCSDGNPSREKDKSGFYQNFRCQLVQVPHAMARKLLELAQILPHNMEESIRDWYKGSALDFATCMAKEASKEMGTQSVSLQAESRVRAGRHPVFLDEKTTRASLTQDEDLVRLFVAADKPSSAIDPSASLPKDGAPWHVVFLLDDSDTMRGARISALNEAMKKILGERGGLPDGTLVSIQCMNKDCDSVPPRKATLASRVKVETYRRWRDIEAWGVTPLLEIIASSAYFLREDSEDLIISREELDRTTIIVLTDGQDNRCCSAEDAIAAMQTSYAGGEPIVILEVIENPPANFVSFGFGSGGGECKQLPAIFPVAISMGADLNFIKGLAERAGMPHGFVDTATPAAVEAGLKDAMDKLLQMGPRIATTHVVLSYREVRTGQTVYLTDIVRNLFVGTSTQDTAGRVAFRGRVKEVFFRIPKTAREVQVVTLVDGESFVSTPEVLQSSQAVDSAVVDELRRSYVERIFFDIRQAFVTKITELKLGKKDPLKEREEALLGHHHALPTPSPLEQQKREEVLQSEFDRFKASTLDQLEQLRRLESRYSTTLGKTISDLIVLIRGMADFKANLTSPELTLSEAYVALVSQQRLIGQPAGVTGRGAVKSVSISAPAALTPTALTPAATLPPPDLHPYPHSAPPQANVFALIREGTFETLQKAFFALQSGGQALIDSRDEREATPLIRAMVHLVENKQKLEERERRLSYGERGECQRRIGEYRNFIQHLVQADFFNINNLLLQDNKGNTVFHRAVFFNEFRLVARMIDSMRQRQNLWDLISKLKRLRNINPIGGTDAGETIEHNIRNCFVDSHLHLEDVSSEEEALRRKADLLCYFRRVLNPSYSERIVRFISGIADRTTEKREGYFESFFADFVQFMEGASFSYWNDNLQVPARLASSVSVSLPHAIKPQDTQYTSLMWLFRVLIQQEQPLRSSGIEALRRLLESHGSKIDFLAADDRGNTLLHYAIQEREWLLMVTILYCVRSKDGTGVAMKELLAARNDTGVIHWGPSPGDGSGGQVPHVLFAAVANKMLTAPAGDCIDLILFDLQLSPWGKKIMESYAHTQLQASCMSPNGFAHLRYIEGLYGIIDNNKAIIGRDFPFPQVQEEIRSVLQKLQQIYNAGKQLEGWRRSYDLISEVLLPMQRSELQYLLQLYGKALEGYNGYSFLTNSPVKELARLLENQVPECAITRAQLQEIREELRLDRLVAFLERAYRDLEFLRQRGLQCTEPYTYLNQAVMVVARMRDYLRAHSATLLKFMPKPMTTTSSWRQEPAPSAEPSGPGAAARRVDASVSAGMLDTARSVARRSDAASGYAPSASRGPEPTRYTSGASRPATSRPSDRDGLDARLEASGVLCAPSRPSAPATAFAPAPVQASFFAAPRLPASPSVPPVSAPVPVLPAALVQPPARTSIDDTMLIDIECLGSFPTFRTEIKSELFSINEGCGAHFRRSVSTVFSASLRIPEAARDGDNLYEGLMYCLFIGLFPEQAPADKRYFSMQLPYMRTLVETARGTWERSQQREARRLPR